MQTMQPFLRLCTGADWHHRHLVSERKYPKIYSVYFTGSSSLDYSAVRHSLLHYLLLPLVPAVPLVPVALLLPVVPLVPLVLSSITSTSSTISTSSTTSTSSTVSNSSTTYINIIIIVPEIQYIFI